mmetsp:Transcript_114733/g.210072  ORF Transcript_114733/g.210072 Transcript_114733/m.210072 type:complete len:303 (-) Transcript_114733:37-945(-)
MLEGLKRWRLTDGHSVVYSDMGGGRSLVSRVCNQDNSTPLGIAQSKIIGDVDNYLEHSKGQIFTFLLLVLLCAFAYSELLSTIKSCASLIGIQGGETAFAKVEGGISLQSISGCHLGMYFNANVLRLIFTVATLIAGATIVAESKNTTDQFIGFGVMAVLLYGFELLAKACVPVDVNAVLSAMKPTPTKFIKAAGVRLSALCIFIVYLGLVIAIIASVVSPQVDKMEEVREVVCGGNQNFIASFNEKTGAVLAKTFTQGSGVQTTDGSSLGQYEKKIEELMSKQPSQVASSNIGDLWAALSQ